VLERFRKTGIGKIALSSITLSELHYGAQKSERKKQNIKRLEEFVYPFDVLIYDEAAAKEYGKIRVNLEKKGQVIGPLDMLIAAHAKSRNLILVTNNVKEFKRIKSLKVENWIAE
jgi:tRNA(fMet)-specific endonuclease VapC